MLFILFTIIRAQETVLIEYPIIQPFSYLQLGQVIGDVQKQKFKVGNLIVNQQFSVIEGSLTAVLIMEYSNSSYPCIIQQFQYPNGTQNFNRCGIDTSVCSTDNNCAFTYQNLHQCYQSCQTVNLTYFDEEIKGDNSQLLIVLLINNQSEVVRLNSTYSINIDNSISFYQISLILCLVFGIVVVIAISLLCILNVKYQELKQTNIKLKLTNRTDDFQKPKVL